MELFVTIIAALIGLAGSVLASWIAKTSSIGTEKRITDLDLALERMQDTNKPMMARQLYAREFSTAWKRMVRWTDSKERKTYIESSYFFIGGFVFGLLALFTALYTQSENAIILVIAAAIYAILGLVQILLADHAQTKARAHYEQQFQALLDSLNIPAETDSDPTDD